MRTILIFLSVALMLFACWRDRPMVAGYSIGLAISAGFLF